MQDMTELVQKYQNTEEFPRMRGTEGGLDYLIIAKDEANGAQLGLKTLIGGGQVEDKKTILVGFRLRAAYMDGYPKGKVVGISEANTDEQLKMPHEVYDFPWEKIGDSYTGFRASLIRTVVLAREPSEAGWVFEDLEHIRFFGKIRDFLGQHVPEAQFVVTADDVADYIKASIYPVLLTMEAEYTNNPVKQLELLELHWKTQVEHHEKHQAIYEAKKAELLEKIEAMEAGEPEVYHPKAHFGDDELVPMDSVAHAMLSGAKPKLSVVEAAKAGEGVTFEQMEGSGSDEEETIVKEADEAAGFDPVEENNGSHITSGLVDDQNGAGDTETAENAD